MIFESPRSETSTNTGQRLDVFELAVVGIQDSLIIKLMRWISSELNLRSRSSISDTSCADLYSPDSGQVQVLKNNVDGDTSDGIGSEMLARHSYTHDPDLGVVTEELHEGTAYAGAAFTTRYTYAENNRYQLESAQNYVGTVTTPIAEQNWSYGECKKGQSNVP